MGLIADVIARIRRRKLLQEQGFLVFCRCGIVLMNARLTAEYGVYTYECESCHTETTFDLTPPVPLKVREWEPA